MNPNEWDEAAAWINLRWDRQPLDPLVAKTWFPFLARYTYADVLGAVNRLAADRPIRPAISELLAAVKSIRASQPAPLALPEFKSTRYGELARQVIERHRDLLLAPSRALGAASREQKEAILAVFEGHQQWFEEGGVANEEMCKELAALLAISPAVQGEPILADAGRVRRRGERYSDELKARYLTAVAEKEGR